MPPNGKEPINLWTEINLVDNKKEIRRNGSCATGHRPSITLID